MVLKVTAYHKFLKYKAGRPFDWFPEEVAQARSEADKNKDKKIVGETAKLKGNSFYGKMIEDIARHHYTTFTADEKDVNMLLLNRQINLLKCLLSKLRFYGFTRYRGYLM